MTIFQLIYCMILLIAKLPSSSVTFQCSFVSSQTRQHSLSIFPLQTTIKSLRYSFFGNVPFIWNKIQFEILSLTDRNAFHRAVNTFYGTVQFVFCKSVCSLCSVFLYTFICNLAIYLCVFFFVCVCVCVCVCVWGSTLVQA